MTGAAFILLLFGLGAIFLLSPLGAGVSGLLNPRESKIQKLAEAIAHAEGFYVAGSLPQRTHNPGDLELGDQGQGEDEGKTVFKNDADGFEALKHQIRVILEGKSHYYDATDTFAQFAHTWTGGDASDNWLAVVTQKTGAGEQESLQDWVGA